MSWTCPRLKFFLRATNWRSLLPQWHYIGVEGSKTHEVSPWHFSAVSGIDRSRNLFRSLTVSRRFIPVEMVPHVGFAALAALVAHIGDVDASRCKPRTSSKWTAGRTYFTVSILICIL